MSTSLQNASLRISAFAVTFLAAPRAFADLFGQVPDIGGVSAGSTDEIRSGVLQILDVVLSFMALIAVIYIVIAGIRLVVSQGEEQEKDKAKKTILYVIIGLIVIVLARVVIGFIITEAPNLLGVS